MHLDTIPLSLPDQDSGPAIRGRGTRRAGQVFTCEQCGNEFYRAPSRIREAAARGSSIRYCSRQCHNTAPRRLHGEEFICAHCGKAFYREPNQIQRDASKGGRPRFCSRKCVVAAKRNDVELSCPECGAIFTRWKSYVEQMQRRGSNMYCSAACRNAVLKRGQGKLVQVSCHGCGTTISRYRANMRERNFCSVECTRGHVHQLVTGSRGKSGVRVDIGHFVRSTWEANVCRVLKAAGIPYEYEPRTFRKGDFCYTPDLLIGTTWIEIKGWMDDRSIHQINGFRQHFPDETLLIVDSEVYEALAREWADRIPEWERRIYS